MRLYGEVAARSRALGSAGIFDPAGVVASQEVGGADPAEHGVTGKSEGREQGGEHARRSGGGRWRWAPGGRGSPHPRAVIRLHCSRSGECAVEECTGRWTESAPASRCAGRSGEVEEGAA